MLVDGNKYNTYANFLVVKFQWKIWLKFREMYTYLIGRWTHRRGELSHGVVDFLLVLIELFFARCYGWAATSDYRLKIGDFAPTGPVDPKFQVEGVAPPTIFLLRKLG